MCVVRQGATQKSLFVLIDLKNCSKISSAMLLTAKLKKALAIVTDRPLYTNEKCSLLPFFDFKTWQPIF
jgi:hypothetical protein